MRLAAVIGAVVGLVATASSLAAQPSPYSLAATRSCLERLPNGVAGLPPATPPSPAVVFVQALTHDDLASSSVLSDRHPRAHKQLGVWTGRRSYEGIVLSFFKSVSDARWSLPPLGGERVRNVIATWDGKASPALRKAVPGCLRPAGSGTERSGRQPPAATLATFAGRWGGHTRALSITAGGAGREVVDAGCCTRVYELSFRILSVRGTLTHATAVYRLTSFVRRETDVKLRHAGELGRLVLRDGIVTNSLTDVYYCSDPAWGATGACGA